MIFIGFLALIMSGCNYFEHGQIQNVGMLLDGEIDEHAWNEKGYAGLMQIEKEFDIDVFYQENITTEDEVRDAVDEFVEEGVNLIFGHGSIYGSLFQEIEEAYPDVHFVYFNGGYYSDNVTSLNFNSHAMGFFSGMIATRMSDSNEVGIITSFESQPEIEGFYEGAKYLNAQTEVHMNYINNWKDTKEAIHMYEEMRGNGVDVFYPAGNSFAEAIINKAEEDGVYAIGYIADQLEIAPDTVLTSTIQHVEQLYETAAKDFDKRSLKGGILTYDFQDDLITLGEFNESVPDRFKAYISDMVEDYQNTGLLPNEK